MHINQDKLKVEVGFLENIVNCYKQLEINLKGIIIGKLSINSPNKVGAKERGILHVLKGFDKPLFRKSIAEPLNEASIIIQEEMRT